MGTGKDKMRKNFMGYMPFTVSNYDHRTKIGTMVGKLPFYNFQSALFFPICLLPAVIFIIVDKRVKKQFL